MQALHFHANASALLCPRSLDTARERPPERL